MKSYPKGFAWDITEIIIIMENWFTRNDIDSALRMPFIYHNTSKTEQPTLQSEIPSYYRMKYHSKGFTRDITEIVIIVESCFTRQTGHGFWLQDASPSFTRETLITLLVEDEKQHKSYSHSTSTTNIQQYLTSCKYSHPWGALGTYRL